MARTSDRGNRYGYSSSGRPGAEHSVSVPAGSAHAEKSCATWLAALAIAIAYGSLIPFDIDLARMLQVRSGLLFDLSFHTPPWEDVFTNLLIYLPVGMTFGLLLGCNRISMIRALLFGAMLSIILERLQVGTTLRVGSWIDVLLNTAGAVIGVPMSIIPANMLERLSRAWCRRPFAVLTAIMSLGITLHQVAPLDFVTTTSALQQEFLETRWSLLGDDHANPGPPPLHRALDGLSFGLFFLALGYVSTLAGLEARLRIHRSLIESASRGLIVVTVVTILRLFLQSHTVDLGLWVAAVIGLALGCWTGAFLGTAGNNRNEVPTPRKSLTTPALLFLASLSIVLSLASAWGADLRNMNATQLMSINWMPFELLWKGRMIDAVSTAVAVATTTVIVVIPMLEGLRRLHWAPHRRWAVTTTMVLIMASLRELGSAASHGRVLDITAPVMALTTVFLIAALSRRLQAAVPSPVPLD
ncbi:MAG: VanZ family protein [Planctomycetota bacterium]